MAQNRRRRFRDSGQYKAAVLTDEITVALKDDLKEIEESIQNLWNMREEFWEKAIECDENDNCHDSDCYLLSIACMDVSILNLNEIRNETEELIRQRAVEIRQVDFYHDSNARYM